MNIPTSTAPPRVLLDRKEVERRTSLSKTTIWRLIKDAAFPKPVTLYGKAAWVESEIDAWIGEHIKARDDAQVA